MAKVKDLENALEAVLFVCTDPVTVKHLSEIFDTEEKEIEDALTKLKDRYDKEDRGITIKQIAGG